MYFKNGIFVSDQMVLSWWDLLRLTFTGKLKTSSPCIYRVWGRANKKSADKKMKKHINHLVKDGVLKEKRNSP